MICCKFAGQHVVQKVSIVNFTRETRRSEFDVSLRFLRTFVQPVDHYNVQLFIEQVLQLNSDKSKLRNWSLSFENNAADWRKTNSVNFRGCSLKARAERRN